MMNTFALGRAVFSGIVCLVFVSALIQAQDFSRTAAYFPVAVAAVGLVAAGALLTSDAWRLGRAQGRQTASNEVDMPSAPESSSRQSVAVLGWLVWILSYVGAIWLLGMEIGTFVFLVASLRWIAKAPWWGYVVAAGVVVLLWYLAFLFSLEWPLGKLLGG
jgi:beta-lactamase regulating signal transducer with metallopeptidase domain